MKKIHLLLLISVLLLAACKQTPETVKVDIEAEKVAINNIFDRYNSAFITQNIDTLVSFMDDDILICGSDPRELWNKQEITDIWTEVFANVDLGYNIFGARTIAIAPDGKSANVVEHYLLPFYSTALPLRNSFYIVKTENNWKILLLNTAIVPRNEDVTKINAALE